MEISINKELTDLRVSFRADIIYENIVGKTFDGQNLQAWVTYMYSTYLASYKGESAVEFNDFIDWLDEDRQRLTDFIAYYSKQMKLEEYMAPQVDASKKGGKSKK